jgi:hypothetical protein
VPRKEYISKLHIYIGLTFKSINSTVVVLISSLLFLEKEAKSVVLLRRRMLNVGYPTLGEADPGGLGACPQKTALQLVKRLLLKARSLLFLEKEAKSVVLLRRRMLATQPSAKPTLEVWGLAPKKDSLTVS